LELPKGERENPEKKSFELGSRQRESFQLSGFHVFSIQEAGIGMSGASGKSGTRFAFGSRDLFERSADGPDGQFPLIRRRRMLGQKGVSDGHASQIEANDPRMIGAEGVDHLQASSPQIDVETGTWATGKTSGGEGDETTFLMSTEKPYLGTKDFGGGVKKRFCVSGPAKSASSDGYGFFRSKGPDLFLEPGENAQSPSAGCGL